MVICDVKSCKAKVENKNIRYRLKDTYYVFCPRCIKEFDDLIKDQLAEGEPAGVEVKGAEMVTVGTVDLKNPYGVMAGQSTLLSSGFYGGQIQSNTDTITINKTGSNIGYVIGGQSNSIGWVNVTQSYKGQI